MSLPENYSELLREKFNSRIDYDEGNEIHPRLAAQLVESGQLREGWKVLDLACGTGFVTFLAAAAVGSRGSVTGVDFSSVLLRQAEEKLRQTGISNVTFREGDVEDIEFLRDSFDAILCSSAFPYIRDKEASLQRIYSWLKKPGGVLAYNAVKSPYTALLTLMYKLLKERGQDVQLPFSDVPDGTAHAALLKKVGFSDVKVEEMPGVLLDKAFSVQEYAEWGWKWISESCQMFFPTDNLLSKKDQAILEAEFLRRATDLGKEMADKYGLVEDNTTNIWLVARP